jgi:2-succinyl-5-enolpyruvyl-6-hydroxy-3-cyclohexene-1-carboxylate synthase
MKMANINTLWAHIIVDELVRCGVRHAVISPGSRSTPLTMAFAAHPDIVDHSVIDERSAGFFALGLTMSLDGPVVLVCTSGTAVANYFPSVCEAFHNGAPVLVLSADRPAWLRDSGAPQAMNQVRFFGDFVKWFHEIAQPDASAVKLRYLRTTIDKAVLAAGNGPVHLNIPFDKPLEPTNVEPNQPGGTGGLSEDLLEIQGQDNGRPWVSYSRGKGLPDVHEALEVLSRSTRPVVLAGASSNGVRLRDEINAWADLLNVPVLAEAASQLRFSPKRSPGVLAVDHWLNHIENRGSFKPDIIIQIGRAPINWPTQRWLSEQSCPVIFVGPEDPHRHANPDHLAGWHLVGEPSDVLPHLRKSIEGWDGAWQESVLTACTDSGASSSQKWGDGRVHETLAEELPDGTAVFVSSSMPLRDIETSWRDCADLRVFFNRGLNGIDGVLSTSFGVAAGWPGRLVTVLGDVAFAHDVGALMTATRENITATVVVIDNQGGAIFDYLPVKDHDRETFEKHFTTAPTHNLEYLCKAHDIDYRLVEDQTALRQALSAHSGIRVVHARTSRESTSRPRGKTATLAKKVFRSSNQTLESPIVFLHGFTDTPDSWTQVIEGLPVTQTLTLPGHNGQTQATDWERTLCDIREALAGQKVHLVGYSMGGRLALGYACAYPGDVLSLTTIGAHAGLQDTDRPARIAADEALACLAEDDFEAFLIRWSHTPILNLVPSSPAVLVAKYLRRRRNRGAGLADALRKLGPGNMPMLRPEDLKMPALFIAGAFDTKYVATAHELAKRAPHGKAAVVESAGHAVHEDQPHAFIDLLRNHVR